MPYKIRKVALKDLYYVYDDKGKRYSNNPHPKDEAIKQMRALYASEGRDIPEKKRYPLKARMVKDSDDAHEKMKKVRESKLNKKVLPKVE
jgi:hypothetical protein